MKVDLEFSNNQLLLNPRFSGAVRATYLRAWQELVEPRYIKHVGIATSGSTGDSIGRLILLSKDAIEASAQAVNERFESSSQDVWFKSLPSFHVGGLGILVRAKLSGAIVHEDRSEKWSATDFYDQLKNSKATLVSLVPTQVFDLVKAGLSAPESVRTVIVGGGRLEESLRLEALKLGWPCLPSYGMTETSSQIATALSAEAPSLVLLSHASARTSSDGRLEVKASSLLSGEIHFDASGKATLTDPKSDDGWFTAADRGRVIGATIIIEGRTADFVKVGGEGVVLARLEETLERLKLEIGFIGDAAILAAQDDRLGARIVMVTDEPQGTLSSSPCDVADADALMNRFNSGVAPFERIREIKRVEKVPRSPLGKLLRAQALVLAGLKPLA